MALPEIIKDIEARVKDTGDKMTGTLSWDGNLASLNLRANHANYDGVISYQTSGNEAMLFTTKNAVTSFMFANGEDIIANMSAERWTKITPGLQIKNNSVYIGSLIGNGETPAYKFYVDGTSYFNGVTAFADPIRQGTTSSDSTISAMNRFQADLFVAGNGAAPNKPSVPGFYLGRSETDENRHMDIVSGGDFAYIDFNKASVVEDFKFRILADVTNGPVNFQWSNATTPQLNIQGSLVVTDGTSLNGTLTFISSTEANRKITTASGTSLCISPKSTLYLDSGSGSSIIFRQGGTEAGRFDPDGHFRVKNVARPVTNNGASLGTSSYYWGSAYLGTIYANSLTVSGRSTFIGKISIPTTGSTWVSGKTLTSASIAIATQQTTDSYHPILAVKSSSGHVWNIGGLGDSVGIYGYYSARTANGTDYSTVWNTANGTITHNGVLSVTGSRLEVGSGGSNFYADSTGKGFFKNTLRIGTSASMTLDGNWCEGIRINAPDGQRVTIALGTTGDTGTNANCWSIHRTNAGDFSIAKNSSDGANGLVMTSTGMGLSTTTPAYRLHVVGDIYANGGWVRVSGNQGLYFESHGGGWYMTGSDYIRAFNDKPVYVSNSGQHAIYTAGGFASAKTSGPVFSTYYNGTWYNTLQTHGNGNLTVDAPGGSVFLAYYQGNTYFGGSTYYIDRSGNFNGNATTATTASMVKGSYTANGGQQNPNYFGRNKVGFLMMNTTVNGNSQYKDWMIMDCYSGDDVGGGVAIGVNRQSLGAYIMRSAAARTGWAESAELLHTANYASILDSRYVNTTGDTMTGAFNLANSTWNKAGDDAYFGDNDTAGSFAIKGINGTTNLKMVTKDATTYGTLSWDGTNFTFSNQVIIANTSDAALSSSSGALRIGDIAGEHLAIDGNEIMAKVSASTAGTLYLNDEGGAVQIGTGGLNVSGAGKLLTLTITSTAATSHLKFSRASANYITAPTGGYVAFVPDGQTVSLAASDLTIANNQVYPGTNNVTSLGTESYRWSNIYANSLIAISGTTSAIMDYTSTNPRIVFSETGTQPVGLVYTDYDSYRSPAGLKVLDMSGSNAKAWFEVEGNVYASTFQGPHNGTVLGVTETAPTAATVYSPLFINTDGSAASTTTKYTRRTNKDYRLTVLEGTASANGYIILTLGNNTATGTAGNKYGILRLYSSDSNYINLRAQNIASNYTVYLPKYAGTMYLIHGGSNSAIGSKSQPVYIAANGRATACATPASGAWFSAVPSIGSDGVMEIGRYIDFHYTTDSTNDFDVRIDCAGTSANTLYLPAVTGQVVVHTNDTAQGSATLPVYVSASGLITPCTASSVFSKLSWTAGAASGPVLNVTVAGQARTSTIPSASSSASGVVTTGAQTFAGNKTFANNIYMTSANAELHMKYDGTSYPILDNYNNGNITINTCGKGLYLGYSNTAAIYFGASGGWGHITSSGIYGAVWNDYAEYRNQFKEIEPGYCVASANNGKVYKTNKRMQACDGIVSDTAGFYIGQTEESQTPLAVAGRVLAYCEGSKYDYQAGDTVCAGPEGKVCKMTREEIREWPDRIVGIVSEIPEYEIWGSGNVPVNGRIWIKVK